MPRYRPYAGPTGRQAFTSFGGTGQLLRISQTDTPELYALAKSFPEALSSALGSLGYFIHNQIKSALLSGGPSGIKWVELSKMHIYRRMDLWRQGEVDPITDKFVHGKRFYLKKRIGNKKVSGNMNMMERWKGRGITRSRHAMNGRLAYSIRYKKYTDARVEIGSVNDRPAKFLAAVQGGKRGSRGVFQFSGMQPITPSMRRAFWAAGVPLKKSTTSITQKERPLIAPIFRAVSPEIENIIVMKMSDYFDRHNITISKLWK
jgi:hypothetical protein